MKTAKKLIFMILVVAFAFIFAACNDEQEHSHSFVDGSCECGEKDPNYVTPHTHSYSSVVTAPTCTEAGYTTFTCECGDTYKEDGEAALGHTEVVDAAVDPTCTTAGKTEGKHCSVCNEVLVAQEEVAALGHTEVVDAAVAATCTTAGKTEGKHCSVCNEVLVAQEEVAALGHTEVVDAAVAATCTEAGKTEGKHCSVCNEVLVAQKEIAALGHKFIDSKCVNCEEQFVAPVGGWTLVTELKDGDNVLIGAPAYNKLLSAEKVSAGSYYNKGVTYSTDDFSNVTDAEIFVVTDNGDGTYTFTSLTGVVIALADSYSSLNNTGKHKSWSLVDKGNGLFLLKNTGRNTYLEWYADKNNWSTYTAGNTKEYELSFYAKGEATDGEHVHNHISSVHDATCTEAGYTAYTCRCGDTYKVDGEAALGHTEVVDAAVAATCTETGKTEGKHCSVCNEVLVAQEEVEALGHSYKEGTCEVCGDKESSGDTEVTKGSADFNTIVTSNGNKGDASYTKTFTTTNGWVTKNSAIQAGGGSVNPQFMVVGPNITDKAVCLNGKTTAYGSITSPTLNGGLSKLVVKFTKMFTDTELSVTVTVTELSTGNTYTHVIARSLPKDEKYVVYTEEWVLETPVTGDFTIEIVNNCPSKNSSSNKDRMTILSIDWEGAVPTHTHEYESTTTATCTAPGVTTYTCSCGDTYTEETPILDHIDTNLDITCDFEGCTKRILPAADSKISLFTANHMIIVSLSNSYYVEGVVTHIENVGSGIFVIADEAGDTIVIRLPKNADGVAYAQWTVGRVVVGDTVRVYGKPSRNSGAPTDQKAKIESGVLTVLEHTHSFSEANCTEAAVCDCLAVGDPALGHIDENADNACDRCSWNMKLVVDNIAISTTVDKTNGVLNAEKTSWTWSNENFDVVVAKAKSTVTLYTTAKDYMQLKKQNTLTVVNKNGAKIQSIIISATNTTQLKNLVNAIGTQYECETNEEKLTVTIKLDTTGDFTFSNVSTSTAYISGVEIVYEK